ncbi:MAG: hypothetical protein EZS28_022693, partial [Streblomastix strix]
MSAPQFRQSIIICDGDVREISRAIEFQIKQRYKLINIETLVQQYSVKDDAESHTVKQYIDSNQQIPGELIVQILLQKVIEESILGASGKASEEAAKAAELAAAQSGQIDGKSKDGGKGDKKTAAKAKKEEPSAAKGKVQPSKGKGSKDSAPQKNADEVGGPESKYSQDPDDAPDVPNYPNQFLVITGLDNDLSTLLYLQQQLLSINCRINALVNIRPVPFVPPAFITSLAHAKSPKLFPILPNTQNDEIGEKDAKGGKGADKKAASQSVGGKVSKNSSGAGSGANAGKDQLTSTNQYSISPIANALIAQDPIDVKAAGSGTLDSLCLYPPKLSLFDSVTISRAQLIDGPAAVLKGIFILEILSGVPFHPEIHIPPDNTASAPPEGEQPTPIVQASSQTRNASPPVKAVAGQKSATTAQVQPTKGKDVKETAPVNAAQPTGGVEEPLDALNVLCSIAPNMGVFNEDPFPLQNTAQALKSTVFGPQAGVALGFPPPPTYPSQNPKNILFSHLTPLNPHFTQVPLFVKPELSKSGPELPLPPHNFWTGKNPLLYVPKDGITLLREMHLAITAYTHRECLYEQWMSDIPRNKVDNQLPYELYLSETNGWLALPQDDSRVIARADALLTPAERVEKQIREKEEALAREKAEAEEAARIALIQQADNKTKGKKSTIQQSTPDAKSRKKGTALDKQPGKKGDITTQDKTDGDNKEQQEGEGGNKLGGESENNEEELIAPESKLDGSLAIDLRQYKRTADRFTIITNPDAIVLTVRNQQSEKKPGSTLRPSKEDNEQKGKNKIDDIIPIIPKAQTDGYISWFGGNNNTQNIRSNDQEYVDDANESNDDMNATGTKSLTSTWNFDQSQRLNRTSRHKRTNHKKTHADEVALAAKASKPISNKQRNIIFSMDVGLNSPLVLHSLLDELVQKEQAERKLRKNYKDKQINIEGQQTNEEKTLPDIKPEIDTFEVIRRNDEGKRLESLVDNTFNHILRRPLTHQTNLQAIKDDSQSSSSLFLKKSHVIGGIVVDGIDRDVLLQNPNFSTDNIEDSKFQGQNIRKSASFVQFEKKIEPISGSYSQSKLNIVQSNVSVELNNLRSFVQFKGRADQLRKSVPRDDQQKTKSTYQPTSLSQQSNSKQQLPSNYKIVLPVVSTSLQVIQDQANIQKSSPQYKPTKGIAGILSPHRGSDTFEATPIEKLHRARRMFNQLPKTKLILHQTKYISQLSRSLLLPPQLVEFVAGRMLGGAIYGFKNMMSNQMALELSGH